MGQAFTPGLQLHARTLVRRVRELPLLGRVEVQVGDLVRADQVVLRAALPGDLALIRGPEELGVDAEEFATLLKVREGDEVVQGTLVAEYTSFFGLFHSAVRSPEAGTVEFITARTGHVGVRLAPRPIEINAYLSGRVASVEPGRSVTVEANGALVQGIFGVGGERIGALHVLDIDPQAEVTPECLPENCRGTILVGGARPTIQALKLAGERGALGLVSGSIDDRCLAEYLGYDLGIALTGDEDVPMTVIITEGFGKLPLSPRVLDLLRPLTGRRASISGATQVRAGALRPEIVVPHDDSFDIPSIAELPILAEGSHVRLIRYPYFGMFAEVVSLPPKPEKIETGASTRILRARLENGKLVTIPRANVELVT